MTPIERVIHDSDGTATPEDYLSLCESQRELIEAQENCITALRRENAAAMENISLKDQMIDALSRTTDANEQQVEIYKEMTATKDATILALRGGIHLFVCSNCRATYTEQQLKQLNSVREYHAKPNLYER